MAKKELSLKSWLIPKLRKLSYQWPQRRQTIVKARVSRGLYKCAECTRQGKSRLWGPKDISVDHIHPMVSVTGWDNWDGILARLFCDYTGLQVLCSDHHDQKTEQENQTRKQHRKKISDGDL